MGFLTGRPRWTTLLVSLLALGALVACRRVPPPELVAFPDDPRVLHGQWRMTVTGLTDQVTPFVYAPRANRLVIWSGNGARVYEYASKVGWVAVEGGPGENATPWSYDPHLEAFVVIEQVGHELNVRIEPVDSSLATELSLEFPAGHILDLAFGAYGSVFALTFTGPADWHLTWWDATTGARVGTRRVPATTAGLSLTGNKRVLAFREPAAWRFTVIDTSDPANETLVEPGSCASDSVGVGSPNWRWFMARDCQGMWQVVDLTAPGGSATEVRLNAVGPVGFSQDGNEVIWLDEGGGVMVFDLLTSATEVLVPAEEALHRGFEHAPHASLYLDRAAGLFIYPTGQGQVRVVGMEGPVEAMTAWLPETGLDGGRFELVAGPLAENRSNTYEFEGTVVVDGVAVPAGDLLVTGWVRAPGLHNYYQPAPELSPLWSVSPRWLEGEMSVTAPGSSTEVYSVRLFTVDSSTVVYPGSITDHTTGLSYSVLLERTD